MALRHWLQLAMTEGIGPILTARLIATAGSAESACAATPKLLQAVEGVGGAKSKQIFESLREAAGEVDAELNRCAAAGVSLLCQDDPGYPVVLRTIPDPPSVLYVKGTLEPRDLNALAIVGSRRCSHYGREQAERFAALLAGAGMTVVSGGARGIDSAAHRGALSHPMGRTIAVLGSGVDTPYPPENAPLFDLIPKRGAVISEFPLGTPPMKENFPRRNRIVSGLSRGVLVIEADAKSGALITARQACDDHGRPVFALPGRIDNAMSVGPHLLIRDGAILVTNLEEILEGLGPLPDAAMQPGLFETSERQESDEVNSPSTGSEQITIGLSDRQRQILLGIGEDTSDVDQIITRTELPAEVVMQELTLLTLKGAVRRVDGQKFERRKSR